MSQVLTPKQNIVQILKFTFFSASAGLIQVLSFTFFKEVLQFDYSISYFTALVLSVLWNFTFNRRFTFQSAKSVPVAMLLVALFYVVFTPLSTWAGNELTLLHWNEYLVLGLTMISNLVLEYLYSRFVIYRNSMNTIKNAK
jgi:putative flippase GtrA